MGTRHLILVYYKGAYHIAQYGQWDGYPSGQGAIVLAFARDPTNITRLKAVIDAGLLYEPTEVQIRNYRDEAETLEEDWYERYMKTSILELRRANQEEFRRPMELVCPTLSCYTGARILELAANAEGPFPVVREGFKGCEEWVYVVDLDEGVVEAWDCDGSREDQIESERFDDVEEWLEMDGYPLSLVGKWALDGLPSKKEFVRKCNRPSAGEYGY
ncbi:hypothetical protein SLS56_003424 [Neofusicoccum ribis]|uniref:Uncharacterized protein n=1 Tax=Neofusicoccum ribis TaxID=45134 RepID=A0ABR3SZG5_9PEZI